MNEVIRCNAMTSYALHVGANPTPLAHVIPDDEWPNMWRVLWPDGQTSDMTNLTRAKDAARVVCSRDPSIKTNKRFHWAFAENVLAGPPNAVAANGVPTQPRPAKTSLRPMAD
jgi:hypothetical protein